MKKLTTLSLSLLLCATAFSFRPADKEANRAAAGNDLPKTGTTRLPALMPAPKVKGMQSQGGFIEDSGKPALFRLTNNKPAFSAPAGMITTTNLYADQLYPTRQAAKVDVETGAITPIAPTGQNMNYTAMGVKDGKLMGFIWARSSTGGVSSPEFRITDLETGESSSTPILDNFQDQFIQCGAYSPEQNAFYGYTYSGWVKYDVASNTYTTPVPRSSLKLPQMTYNSREELVYGLNQATGEICSYDLTTGQETHVATNPALIMSYAFGFAYDYKSDTYLYGTLSETSSELLTLDPVNFTATTVCSIQDGAQLGYLYVNEVRPIEALAPEAAEFVSSDFANGSLTGTITYRMPSVHRDNTTISGDVDYTLYINDVEYTTGSAPAGQEFAIQISSGVENGFNTFKLTPSISGNEGLSVRTTLYIGNDTPLAPENVELTLSEITWSPVTEGINGGYLDLQNLTYKVELNGQVIAENVAATSCPTGISADSDLQEYTAVVYAVCNGLTSEGASSEPDVFGSTYKEPMSILPTVAEAKFFSVIDNNEDGKTWYYSASDKACRYSYHSKNQADDYLILPPVNITDAEVMHQFNFYAWTQNTSFPEAVEVYIGTEPTVAAMSQQIMDTKVISCTPSEPIDCEAFFSVDEPGIYYLAVKCVSPKDRYDLCVNRFTLDTTDIYTSAPMEVEELQAVPAGEGELKATLTFKAPTQAINGQPITEEITLVITSPATEKSVTASAGENVTVEIEAAQGSNDFMVQSYIGSRKGLGAKCNCWCGVDIPVSVNDLEIVMDETNYIGTMTWTKPTVGEHNGYVADAGYDYYLYEFVQVGSFWGIPMYDWQQVCKIGTDAFSYTLDLSDRAPVGQSTCRFGIAVGNESGISSSVCGGTVYYGDLYELPATESFEDGALDYQPVVYNADLDGNEVRADILINTPSEECTAPNGGYALVASAGAGESCSITLPKFSIKGLTKAAFLPTFYNGGFGNFIVKAKVAGSNQQTTIFNLNEAEGLETGKYITPVIELPESLQNMGWVEIVMEIYFEEGKTEFNMSGYGLMNAIPHDLKINVEGSVFGYVGNNTLFEAMVENVGVEPAQMSGIKFTLLNEDNEIVSEETIAAGLTLQSGEKVITEYNHVFNIEDLGQYTCKAELIDADDVDFNNVSSMTLTVEKGIAIAVDDLAYTEGENAEIDLTWSEPEVITGFESFEYETPFALNDGHIGAFTQKSDGKPTFTWEEANPEILREIIYAPGFNVVRGSQLSKMFNRPGKWDAADGDQFVMAFCPADKEKADAWLISPSVEGGSMVEFETRPISTIYGTERIELCYSTVDNDDTENFEIIRTISLVDEWQHITFTLPENAVRFALHYVSENVFGIAIDEIRYVPANDNLEVSGYEIFRSTGSDADFTMIGSCDHPGYTDATADRTQANTYYVVPVLNNGESGVRSNMVKADTNVGVDSNLIEQGIYGKKGHILVLGHEGKNMTISDAAGVVIVNRKANATETVKVPAGIYIVKVGELNKKVSVR